MVVGKNRNVIATINLENLSYNIKQIKSHAITTQQLFAVVKADAYGHGAVQVSKYIESEVDGFCVALYDEAVELRENGIKKPILILGLVDEALLVDCVINDLSVTFTSLAFLQKAKEFVFDKPLKLHLALDTGMNRIGAQSVDEVCAIEQFIAAYPEKFDLEGVFTHFATADGEDDNKVNRQYELFEQLVAALEVKPKYTHLANSAMTLWRNHFPTDIARVGIVMYGLNPSDFVLDIPFDVKSILKLEAKISHVHLLKKGESVSYGAKYIAKKDEWVATLPIGYADGWRRAYGSAGVYLNGQRCDVLGVICMDQMMIRVPEGTQVGEWVELLGDNQSASDVAACVGTIGYEILCGLSQRVSRQYI